MKTDGDEQYRVTSFEGQVVRIEVLDPRIEVSDGSHTFTELYDHRRALTAVLASAAATASPPDSWRSKEHHPANDRMFPGYFIVGIQFPTGLVTYHYEMRFWDDFAAVPEITHAPPWDGATPADSLRIMLDLARSMVEPE